MVNGVSVPVTAINQQLPMRYQGVYVPVSGTLLYTSPYSLATPTGTDRMNFRFAQVDPTTSPTTINTTSQLQLVAVSAAPMRVSEGEVVVSASDASALAALQVGDTVSLSTTSSDGCNDVGGHPILLNDGVVTPINASDTYLMKRYPRTVVGWTAEGDTVLMCVGGRDGRQGATASQLDRLLRSLSVVTAIDLDGGESTSLFANGHVIYHAGKAERAVSTSLLVVANPVTPTPPTTVPSTPAGEG